MRRILRVLGSYVWWTHPRGSVHYDVMVTLILLFLFLAPLKINFKDKPAPANAHPDQIAVFPDGEGGVVYQVPAAYVNGKDAATGQALGRALQPVAGKVTVSRYEPLRDARGKLIGYKVWIERPQKASE